MYLDKFYPTISLPEPDARALRRAMRKMPTFMLKDAYARLSEGCGTTLPIPFEGNILHFKEAVKEVLFERGELPKAHGTIRATMTYKSRVSRAKARDRKSSGTGIGIIR